PEGVNMVRSMWLFMHNFHTDGTLSRYKVRLVANGSSHQLDVDFDETFSLVVKPATIRTVLSLVVSRQWPIHQLDVKNDFLNGFSGCLLTYMDDIILTASCPALLLQIIGSLNNEFDMTDLGVLNYFLGISVDHTPTGLFLSQNKYLLQLLERAHMVTCNPSRTPVDAKSKLGPEDLSYAQLLERAHMVTCNPSRTPVDAKSKLGPEDLSYAVQQICLYMHDLREPHLAALKRILRYVQGTLDLGLHLYMFSTTSLVGYIDADWAGCPFTSSVEAEYQGVASVVAETAWLCNLLRELHYPLSTATLVYCDNVSAVYMSVNPVQHQRTKHIKIDIYFVRDMVTIGLVRVLHVPSRFQYVDIFTKGLPSALFEKFRSSLSVRHLSAPTARAY
nr:ribonuclease H-like domain-containing protein [Tanacetum cinerariifolium]